MASMPGIMAVREQLAAVYVRPLCNWAWPLLVLVAKKAIPQLWRAILRSETDW